MDYTKEFLEYAAQQVHPRLLEWYSLDQIKIAFSAEVARDAQEFFTPEFASSFAKHFISLGLEASRYNHRLLEVNGLRFIAGIRFFSGNIERPFISVARISKPLGSDAEKQVLTDFLQVEFAEFKPLTWQIFQSSHLPYQFVGCTGDKRVLVGKMQDMNTLPKPSHFERVRLEPATNLEFYPRYEASYQNLHAKYSWLADVSRMESFDDLQEYLINDQVFEIFVDNQWAGITVASRKAEFGLSGWYMIEITLEERWQGQGLGVAVQRALVSSLEFSEFDCLFGTIGAVNIPMQKTAARVGRIDIGGEYIIDF
jgi:RimJ/RimL family protein N-acetyltransferase